MRLVEAKLLKHGLKALSKADLISVPKSHVGAIVDYVSELSGIPEEDLHIIGSAGKAETSNDLDLAVDVNKYNPFKIHEKMVKELGEEYSVFNNGTKVGSYAVPVGPKYRIQADLMFVDNVEWAKFSYFSPGEKSKYKGAVRAVLLSAVAASLEEKGVDAFKHIDDDDTPIVRVGRGIDMTLGLKRLFQMRPHKKYGEGYVKALKNVDPEEIRQMHPDIEFDDQQVVISDPLEVIQILFGPGTRPENVDTTEEILDLIERFPPGRRKKILQIAKKRAQDLARKGFELPEELR